MVVFGWRSATVLEGRPRFRRQISRLVAIGAVVAFVALDLVAPLGTSHVVIEMGAGAGATGHAPFSTLSSLTAAGTPRCPHRTPAPDAVGSLLGTTGTRGSIMIVLPTTCQGKQVTFEPPLVFVAGASSYATLGLIGSSWPSSLGQVSVCVAVSGHVCTSTTLTLTSASAPPLSTNVPSLTAGDSYGPGINVQFTSPGVATIQLDLAVEQYQTSTGTPALVQQDWILLTIALA